ncbi:hypothetical protein B9J93_15185 [Vibrio sp. V17_P4S1T151]|uniref:hypothetical protein n=1 Tax=unclassified Vibrio TaxID=2614977 RepID=UPI000B8EBFE7|nr:MULTISPECIES: hypothetical protein [unclassified Vibrio]OXX43691.1 hypothetical protein B9J93_15185 [Vibrio sp. V17_P4S1T151]OXX64376.1 hypothetical protein B9J89_00270 [Vibrio sp. V15_P4S5T153]
MNEQITNKSKELESDGYCYQLNVLANQEFSSSNPKQVFLVNSKSPLTKGDMISLPIELSDDDIEKNVSKYRSYSILKATHHLDKPFAVLEILSQMKIIVEKEISNRLVEIDLPQPECSGDEKA